MSRIGKLPIVIPAGVQVELNGSDVKVKGPKGELNRSFSPLVNIKMEDQQVVVARSSDEKIVRALHGTTRAVIQNMVTGVSEGYSKTLEIQGVGYKAELDGKKLVINVGYSHPVYVDPPDGIEFDVTEKNRNIVVNGSNKEIVGQVAADIRKIRPPEPYKGKGIRYLGERVRRKPGKSAVIT
ncbi:MAG TPA: 50S ribosomal protein L6 [Pelolinea sp.]|nr:50S ribosomal protein L6 [Pelolinea sp.]